MIPAPRGTGCVAAILSKKIIQYSGIDDIYTSCTGQTKTKENFARAVFYALKNTYSLLTPDLWKNTLFLPSPFIKYAE
jgi:small subunit ribosomal protein S2e